MLISMCCPYLGALIYCYWLKYNRPISQSDINPENRACNFILQDALSEEAVHAFSRHTNQSNFVEDRNFSQLRKILGLSLLDPETEVQLKTVNVDRTDALDRIALV